MPRKTAGLEEQLDVLSLDPPLFPKSFAAQLNALISGSKRTSVLKCSSHPTLPLKIYNYTDTHGKKRARTDDVVAMCRGLVIERDTGKVVGRPMRAFDNYDHRTVRKLSDKSFTILEKLDGSMGTWFCYQGTWLMTTRGSFNNEQIKQGTIIAEKLGLHKKCDPAKTYNFEIIYPQNKITVDYGDRSDLILLAVIDTESGVDTPNKELPAIAEALGVNCAKRMDFHGDIEALKALNLDNEEGFVIRFNENGLRAKVKFQKWYDAQSRAKAKRGDELEDGQEVKAGVETEDKPIKKEKKTAAKVKAELKALRKAERKRGAKTEEAEDDTLTGGVGLE